MPHQSLQIIPGVDQTKTITLNEAAASVTDLIRFAPDRSGLGLPQKLGGWTRFYPNSIGSYVRALLAWEDINSQSWLGVAAEETLNVINEGTLYDITPQTTAADVAVSFSTTSGSDVVEVDAIGSGLDQYDVVYIKTQVSVGGLILFGAYPVIPVSTDQFQIQAKNIFGDPAYATATVAAGGAVAVFTTTSGDAAVGVELEDHGLSVGGTFPVLVSTSVGGMTLLGNYIVSSVTDADNFTIIGPNIASSTDTQSENGGDASFIYYNGIGPLTPGTGFGVGGFGTGGFGSGSTSSSSTGTPITSEDWTLDNWGENFISCPLNGPIFQWSPTTNDPVATIIPEAPIVNAGILVAMPQRQIVAWGSTENGIQDPLLIRYCDVNNYNTWIGKIGNQAGTFRISKGSKIIQCIQASQQILVFTDIGLWSMQYVGPKFIYSFNEIGTGCGLIGRKAACSFNGSTYWMGQSQFFQYSGQGVQPLPCPVWDVIFQDLDTENLNKIRVAPNSNFGEITWYYPTTDSNEINKYVKVNLTTGTPVWDFGTLARTAWINQSVLGPPIGVGTNKVIYQHETSPDADGEAMNSYFQTGYFALSDADVMTFIDQIWPDMKWGYYGGTQSASIQITFFVADYPGQTPRVYGPFTVTQATEYVTPRLRGRLVSIKIESTDIGSFWRLGRIRYRYQPDGRF